MSNASARRRISCALCSSTSLYPVLELPDTPLANQFVVGPTAQQKYELKLFQCSTCHHVQLGHVVNPRLLFDDYVYVAGTSPSFVKHFRELAQRLESRLDLSEDSFIVDIGSNDGTLLKAFQDNLAARVVGVEPATRIAEKANAAGIRTLNTYWNRAEALQLRVVHGPADLITANNVFAHTEDLQHFTEAVRDLLGPDGEFVFEVSYLGSVVENMLFDTIYHEHLSYHSLTPLIPFFERYGMHLYDAEIVDTHGGSLRCYVSRARKHATSQLQRLLNIEDLTAIHQPRTYYRTLESRIRQARERMCERLKSLASENKYIVGYGAPAKLTTLMYTFGLDEKNFQFIIDDSPWKQGLCTPGKHIPIYPGKETVAGDDAYRNLTLNLHKADVCVVFAWNFFDQIVAANADWHGLWINPISGKELQT